MNRLSAQLQHPCRVVSDLHLFTRRSDADEYLGHIQLAVRNSRTFVLAGDIFDFRWSRFPSAEATAEEARRWLEALIKAGPETQFHYVLGNHDHAPALIEQLESLAAAEPRFRWHPYQVRIGNAVFLHGDASNPRMNQERLEAYRLGFAKERPASAMAHRMYRVAMAMRLHVVGARLVFKERFVVRRLTAHLRRLGPEWSNGVRNVYFGHTHLALSGVEHDGRRFHNCGSPMRGLSFQILEADLS
jgi:UDP-2,3-diacylglucosamine hydrolase